MKKVQPFTLFRLALMGMELSYLYLLASLLGGPVYILILALLLYPLALLSNFALNRSVVSHQLRFKIGLYLVILVILAVVGERLIVSLAAGQADVLGIVLRLGFCGLGRCALGFGRTPA